MLGLKSLLAGLYGNMCFGGRVFEVESMNQGHSQKHPEGSGREPYLDNTFQMSDKGRSVIEDS